MFAGVCSICAPTSEGARMRTDRWEHWEHWEPSNGDGANQAQLVPTLLSCCWELTGNSETQFFAQRCRPPPQTGGK